MASVTGEARVEANKATVSHSLITTKSSSGSSEKEISLRGGREAKARKRERLGHSLPLVSGWISSSSACTASRED